MNTMKILGKLRLSILRGALFAAPICLCLFLIKLTLSTSQSWLGSLSAELVRNTLPEWLYASWFPDGNIPGLSLILALILLYLLGAIASWHCGRRGLSLIDYLFLSIPLISSVYSSLRKLVEAIGEPGKSRFQKVVLVDWPNKDTKAVAFVANEIDSKEASGKKYAVFIPQMPNPTSGFVVIVDAASVVETDMSMEEALQFCLSLGVLVPPNKIL